MEMQEQDDGATRVGRGPLPSGKQSCGIACTPWCMPSVWCVVCRNGREVSGSPAGVSDAGKGAGDGSRGED